MREEWRPVVGFEGWYEVSNHGHVRRIKPERGTRSLGMPLTPTINTNGYHQISLSRNNIPTVVRAHQLVAKAFIGPCPPGREINHKNFDRTDNRVENLEWVTRAENIEHLRKGRGIHNTKLTEKDVRTIRRIHPLWSDRKLADRFGVRKGNIYFILQRRTWKHVTDDGPVDEALLREAMEDAS